MKCLVFTMVFCGAISTFAQKINYSGNWLINKSKTDFEKSRAAEWVVPRTLKIEQAPDKLTLTRINVNAQLEEQPAIVETLSFDDTPFQRKSGDATTVTTSLIWTSDESFTLTRKGVSTASEIWILEDGGKTLAVDRSVEQADGGKYKIKCYYDKQ
jgi:hypothetical protein